MVVMNEDTDFESNEPLSVEKRVEMFFIPGNVATQADNQFRDQNDENDDDIGNGFRNACKCANHCLDNFILQDVAEHIYNIRELEKTEKELLIMSSLSHGGFGKKLPNPRKRVKYSYTFQNHQICRGAFQFVYDVKEHTLDSLQTHLHKHGVTPRVHGNKGKKAHNAFTFQEIQNAVQFLTHYANQHGIPQPAGPRGGDPDPPIFLPCSDTKEMIHKHYSESCVQCDLRALGLSSFKDVWLRCTPHIRISTPRTDVCHICEKHRSAIKEAVGDAEKLQSTIAFQDHLQDAAREKLAYQQAVKESLEELKDVHRGYGPIPSTSTQYTKVHYTFDFSQQMFIPHHARQMGPIYFLVPRKVQLFGVRVDGVPRQYNYLIDENETIGKHVETKI